MGEVKRTERGWAGHFCCSSRCLFRRNTLLEYENIKIVVSTVGLMEDSINKDEEIKFEEIAPNKYYETMAFYSNLKDKQYYDADVSKEISFGSKRAIDSYVDKDNEANEMHENVIKEIIENLKRGLYK